jgi:hypothetical protein
VQKVREAANKASNSKRLSQLAVTLNQIHSAKQSFPASLAEILPFIEAPLDGAIDGYKWTLLDGSPHHWRLAADPIPGVTGSETGFLELGFTNNVPFTRLDFVPTPGSDAGRSNMLDMAFSHGASAFSSLAGLLPFIEQTNLFRMIRPNLAMQGTSQTAFHALAAADGSVTLSSIGDHLTSNASFGDGSVRVAMQAFWNALTSDLQLGARHENWRFTGGINALPAVQQPQLFSFDGLSRLTGLYVSDDRLLRTLLTDLKLAKMAQDHRDPKEMQKFLNAFISAVNGGTINNSPAIQGNNRHDAEDDDNGKSGRGISPSDAYTLISIARSLMENTAGTPSPV